MAYKIKSRMSKKEADMHYKWEAEKHRNSYELLELRAQIEYGSRYSDLSDKEKKEIALKVAKDVN